MHLTVVAGAPSIMCGRGGTPCTGAALGLQRTGFKREMWKVGLIFIEQGRAKWYATRLILLRILKDPMHHGASFLDSKHKGRSLVANQMHWPGQTLRARCYLQLA